MKTEKMIKVWPFYDAPADYQALSQHGGDEDWLAFMPRSIGVPPCWLEATGYNGFGVCDVSRHEVEGGTVFIGAHA